MQEFCVLLQIHAFLSPVLFVMMVAPEADHLRLQKQWHDLDEQEVYRHHLHQVLVSELGTRIIYLLRQRLHVSSDEQIAHAILDDTQDSSNPRRYVP